MGHFDQRVHISDARQRQTHRKLASKMKYSAHNTAAKTNTGKGEKKKRNESHSHTMNTYSCWRWLVIIIDLLVFHRFSSSSPRISTNFVGQIIIDRFDGQLFSGTQFKWIRSMRNSPPHRNEPFAHSITLSPQSVCLAAIGSFESRRRRNRSKWIMKMDSAMDADFVFVAAEQTIINNEIDWFLDLTRKDEKMENALTHNPISFVSLAAALARTQATHTIHFYVTFPFRQFCSVAVSLVSPTHDCNWI